MTNSNPIIDPLDQLVRHRHTGEVLLGGRTLRQVLADHEKWRLGEGGEQAVFHDCAFRGCVFRGCSFRVCEFSGCVFRNCEFRGCEFSGCTFLGCEYRGCKFRGCSFRVCEYRGCEFHDCAFRGCELRGCEFRDCEFRFCAFSGRAFSGCAFPGLDIPVVSRIHRRVYEAARQPGALDMSSIHHACGTKHCRAGWAVHLAGESGYSLERQVGWSLAAALIYLHSDPKLERIPDFYATDDEALEDMRRMAEQEAEREQEASHE